MSSPNTKDLFVAYMTKGHKEVSKMLKGCSDKFENLAAVIWMLFNAGKRCDDLCASLYELHLKDPSFVLLPKEIAGAIRHKKEILPEAYDDSFSLEEAKEIAVEVCMLEETRDLGVKYWENHNKQTHIGRPREDFDTLVRLQKSIARNKRFAKLILSKRAIKEGEKIFSKEKRAERIYERLVARTIRDTAKQEKRMSRVQKRIARVEHFVALRNSGLTLEQIGEKEGLTRQGVLHIFTQFGFSKDDFDSKVKIRHDKIAKDFLEHRDIEETCKRFDLSFNTVRAVLKEKGLFTNNITKRKVNKRYLYLNVSRAGFSTGDILSVEYFKTYIKVSSNGKGRQAKVTKANTIAIVTSHFKLKEGSYVEVQYYDGEIRIRHPHGKSVSPPTFYKRRQSGASS